MGSACYSDAYSRVVREQRGAVFMWGRVSNLYAWHSCLGTAIRFIIAAAFSQKCVRSRQGDVVTVHVRFQWAGTISSGHFFRLSATVHDLHHRHPHARRRILAYVCT